jgi:hypothetical protein
MRDPAQQVQADDMRACDCYRTSHAANPTIETGLARHQLANTTYHLLSAALAAEG